MKPLAVVLLLALLLAVGGLGYFAVRYARWSPCVVACWPEVPRG